MAELVVMNLTINAMFLLNFLLRHVASRWHVCLRHQYWRGWFPSGVWSSWDDRRVYVCVEVLGAWA